MIKLNRDIQVHDSATCPCKSDLNQSESTFKWFTSNHPRTDKTNKVFKQKNKSHAHSLNLILIFTQRCNMKTVLSVIVICVLALLCEVRSVLILHFMQSLPFTKITSILCSHACKSSGNAVLPQPTRRQKLVFISNTCGMLEYSIGRYDSLSYMRLMHEWTQSNLEPCNPILYFSMRGHRDVHCIQSGECPGNAKLSPLLWSKIQIVYILVHYMIVIFSFEGQLNHFLCAW